MFVLDSLKKRRKSLDSLKKEGRAWRFNFGHWELFSKLFGFVSIFIFIGKCFFCLTGT